MLLLAVPWQNAAINFVACVIYAYSIDRGLFFIFVVTNKIFFVAPLSISIIKRNRVSQTGLVDAARHVLIDVPTPFAIEKTLTVQHDPKGPGMP